MSPEPKVSAAFVVSMALEPRMLALSTKVVPKSLRPAQSPEFRGPVKLENTRAAHPYVKRGAVPGAMHVRATLARMH
jgi:hypothetical protein